MATGSSNCKHTSLYLSCIVLLKHEADFRGYNLVPESRLFFGQTNFDEFTERLFNEDLFSKDHNSGSSSLRSRDRMHIDLAHNLQN